MTKYKGEDTMRSMTQADRTMMYDMMMCCCSFMVMKKTMVSFHVSYPIK